MSTQSHHKKAARLLTFFSITNTDLTLSSPSSQSMCASFVHKLMRVPSDGYCFAPKKAIWIIGGIESNYLTVIQSHCAFFRLKRKKMKRHFWRWILWELQQKRGNWTIHLVPLVLSFISFVWQFAFSLHFLQFTSFKKFSLPIVAQ